MLPLTPTSPCPRVIKGILTSVHGSLNTNIQIEFECQIEPLSNNYLLNIYSVGIENNLEKFLPSVKKLILPNQVLYVIVQER